MQANKNSNCFECSLPTIIFCTPRFPEHILHFFHRDYMRSDVLWMREWFELEHFRNSMRHYNNFNFSSSSLENKWDYLVCNVGGLILSCKHFCWTIKILLNFWKCFVFRQNLDYAFFLNSSDSVIFVHTLMCGCQYFLSVWRIALDIYVRINHSNQRICRKTK